MFSMVACGTTGKSSEDVKKESSEVVQIPNPFVEWETMEEASETTGFQMSVPDSITGFDEKGISTMDNSMIQVNFHNEENSINFRKAKGNEDISGDYNEYSMVKEIEINDQTVTVKGNGEKISLAVWTDEEYTYAIGSTQPLEETEIIEYCKYMIQ